MKFSRFLLFLGAPALSAAAEFKLTDQKATIQSPAVNEASGLAISRQNGGFLWTLNDSGGTPELHLLTTEGEDRGEVTVSNAANIDWEDMASFTLDGKSYLLIADTGDNNAVHQIRTIHILREPKLPTDGAKIAGSVTASWHIDFTYQGGPRDCEAVAVDVPREKIILITKRTQPPEIYEMPLRPGKNPKPLVLEKRGVTSVPSPAGNLMPIASQPVGMDISADNSLAAVVTYYAVFLFPRAAGETWLDAFSKRPEILAPHGLGQAESVAFSKDGKSLYVTSEGKNPPIRRYCR